MPYNVEIATRVGVANVRIRAETVAMSLRCRRQPERYSWTRSIVYVNPLLESRGSGRGNACVLSVSTWAYLPMWGILAADRCACVVRILDKL